MDMIMTPATVVTPSADSVILTVDSHFDRHDIPHVLHLVQYDRTLPVIAVNLYHRGERYTVPTGAAVNIRWMKPDYTYVYNPVLGVSSNRQTVYVTISAQMTMAHGHAVAVVEIVTNNGGVVSTQPILFHVDKNPVSETGMKSSDEFKTLENYIEEAEKSAESAKNSANNASTSAANAASSASSASTSASNAAKANSDAQSAKTDAQNAAKAAKESQDSAASALRDALVALQGAQAARTGAETARNESQTAAQNAAGSAASAAKSEETASQKAADAQMAATNAEKAANNAEQAKETVETIRNELQEALEKAAGFSDTIANLSAEIEKLKKTKLDHGYEDDGYLYLTADDIVVDGPLGPICGEGTPKYVVNYFNWDGSFLYQALVPEGGNAINPVEEGLIDIPTRGTATATSMYVFDGFGTLPKNIRENKNLTASYYFAYKVTFMNLDEVVDIQWVKSGANAVNPETIPTREPTEYNTFEFAGWSTDRNASTVTSSALTKITASKILYASYNITGPTFTVRFMNDAGTSTYQTVTNIPYGGEAYYTGSTPTLYLNKFTGWDPQPVNIVDDIDCYAQFVSTVVEIEDDWDTIIAACNDGSYDTKYDVGNYKPLDLGELGIINMQIAGKRKELIAGLDSGVYVYAPLTWMGIELLTEARRMTSSGTKNPYVVGPSWSKDLNTSGLPWKSNVEYTDRNNLNGGLARAKWTFKANGDGELTIGYKTSNTWSTNGHGLTIYVNQEPIVESYRSTNRVDYVVPFSKDETIEVVSEFLNQSTTYAYSGYVYFENTDNLDMEVDVEDGEYKDTRGYVLGTGVCGGWKYTELRSYYQETVYPAIPENVRNGIKTVTISFKCRDETQKEVTLASADEVWIPQQTDIYNGSLATIKYNELFTTSDTTRVKHKYGSTTNSEWWLRNVRTTMTEQYQYVTSSGSANISSGNSMTTARGLPICFCT